MELKCWISGGAVMSLGKMDRLGRLEICGFKEGLCKDLL